MLEHIRDWRAAVSNMKRVCAERGHLLVTVPSSAFGYHAYPHDFWRYELADLETIFGDFDVLSLRNDPLDCNPLVRANQGEIRAFVKARKPKGFTETDLSTHRLYSVLDRERKTDIGYDDLTSSRYRTAALWAKLRDRLSALDLVVRDRIYSVGHNS